MFEINYDYTSLYCHTNLELDDEDLVLPQYVLSHNKRNKRFNETLMRSFDKQASKSDINSKRKYKHCLAIRSLLLIRFKISKMQL